MNDTNSSHKNPPTDNLPCSQYHGPMDPENWPSRCSFSNPWHQLTWVCMWYAMVYQHNDRWGGKWINIYIYKDKINDIMRNGYEMLWIQSISPWYFLNDETFCKTIRYSDPSRRAAFHPWVTAGTTPRIWVETWAWRCVWNLGSETSEEFDIWIYHGHWIIRYHGDNEGYNMI